MAKASPLMIEPAIFPDFYLMAIDAQCTGGVHCGMGVIIALSHHAIGISSGADTYVGDTIWRFQEITIIVVCQG